jgi:phosphoglycerate kinase
MKDLKQLTDLSGKKVLVRIDTDVEVAHDHVTDDFRLQAALPTIRYLSERGAAITIVGYLGRPKKVDPAYRLEPVARHLAHLLVPYSHLKIEHIEAKSPVIATQYRLAKQVVMLENTRFDPGENDNDPEFAKQLAEGHDYFVNESFATAHRNTASAVGVAKLLPSYPGFRLVDEIAHIDLLRESPEYPFTLIVGGAKLEEKLGLLAKLLPKVDHVLIGGVTANVLLEANGINIKKSVDDPDFLTKAKKLLQHDKDKKIVLPADYIWDHDQIMDIGPETVKQYKTIISKSKTIFWAGSLGYAEKSQFAVGTHKIAEALAHHDGVRIIGGGDTAAAIYRFDLVKKMSFVSTGGGAALEYLSGEKLPGVEALQ